MYEILFKPMKPIETHENLYNSMTLDNKCLVTIHEHP